MYFNLIFKPFVEINYLIWGPLKYYKITLTQLFSLTFFEKMLKFCVFHRF